MKKTHRIHNDKAFAMLHDSSAIAHTEWQGLYERHAFVYLRDLISLEEHPLPLGLSAEQKQLVLDILDDLIIFLDCFEHYNYQTFLALLETRSRMKKGIAYLPAGWCGKTGHLVVLKAELVKDNSYRCSYINEGAGSNFHRPLSKGKDKTKCSYESHSRLFDFDSEFAQVFVQNIVSLLTDHSIFSEEKVKLKTRKTSPSLSETIKPYDEKDLYGVLAIFGEETPIGQISLLKAATPQRVGSCTVTNSKMAYIDGLLFLATMLPNQIKRFIYALKLSSLDVAHAEFMQDQCDSKVFGWALREANVRVAKHYPEIISAEEVIISNQLLDSIGQSFEKRMRDKLSISCRKEPVPELRVPIKDKNLTINLVSSEPALGGGHFYRSRGEDSVQFTAQREPKTFLDHLRQADRSLKENTGKIRAIEILRYLRTLPKTSGLRTDEFWDQIPENDLFPIIDSLCSLCEAMSNNENATNMALFEGALIVYDIAAQLGPRLAGLYLEDDYSLGISDFSREGLVFESADNYYFIKQIVENFQRRNAGKMVIFTNDINSRTEDKTCHYITERLLTKELRAEAVEILKDLQILELNQTDAPNELLINVLLMGEFKSNSSWASDAPTVVDVAKIVNQSYQTILRLTVLVHRFGNLHQKRGSINGYKSIDNGKLEKQVDLCIRENSDYRGELKLSKELEYHYRSLKPSGLISDGMRLRDPCGVSLNCLPLQQDARYSEDEFVDWAENVIYYPVPQLRDLIAISHHYLKNPSDRSIGIQRVPPYQYDFSGSFSPKSTGWRDAPQKPVLEELDEELRRIEASGSLRNLLLFEWLLSNFDRLSLAEARTRFYALFFEFGYLDYAFTWHPEDLCQLAMKCFKKVLKQAATYLEGSDDNIHGEVFLWLCALHYYFWEYARVAAKAYGFSIESCRPINVRNWITSEIKANKRIDLQAQYAQLLLLSFKDQPPQSSEDFSLFLAAKWLMTMKEKSASNDDIITDMDIACANLWHQYFELLNRYLESLDNNSLDRIVEGAMQLCQIELANREWSCSRGLLLPANLGAHSVLINLRTGNIANKGVNIRDRTTLFKHQQLLKALRINTESISFHEKSSESYYGGVSAIFSSDGKWQFDFDIYNNRIVAAYKKVCLEGKQYWFKVLNGDEKRGIKELAQLFEEGNSAAPEYLYAKSDTDEGLSFVEPLGGGERGYLYLPESGWLCLKRQGDGSWVQERKVFCNLQKPEFEYEISWNRWLNQTLGVFSLVPIAKINDDSTVELESLSWRKFNLSFVNQNGVLFCQQHPGFFWSDEEPLEILGGLRTLVTLCDKKGNKKFLLPPFLFLDNRPAQIGSENNKVFSHEFFMDLKRTLNHQDCFEYTFDRHGELCGQSIEADLYLALVFRCLGDYPKDSYRRAMQALIRSSNPRNNTELQVQILSLTEFWPDHSALGAAFDCQILLRLYRHHAKWSKQPDKWLHNNAADTVLLAYCLEQFKLYQKNISTRKEAICIVPDYLKLSEGDKAILGKMKEYLEGAILEDGEDRQNLEGTEEYHNGYVSAVNFSTNLKQMSTYFSLSTEARILGFFSNKMFNDKFHRRQETDYPLNLRVKYVYTESEEVYELEYSNASNSKKSNDDSPYQSRKVTPAHCPGYDHLLRYFVNLFEDAISEDPCRVKRVKAKIFLLARNDMNDKTGPFLALLSLVVQNKKQFVSLRGKHKLTRECVRAIARVAFQDSIAAKQLNTASWMPFVLSGVSLTEIKPAQPTLIPPKREPFSFERIQFKVLQESPCEDLLNAHFLPESKAVVTTDFLDTLDDSDSPIEQRLNDRLQKGNEENKKAVKVVYRRKGSSVSLTDLRKSLVKKKSDGLDDAVAGQRALLELANNCQDAENPSMGAYFQAARRGEQKPDISLRDLVDALLWQDFSELQQKNPFLTIQRCDALMGLLIEYLALQSSVDQIENALSLINGRDEFDTLEPYELQMLGRILAAKRYYPIQEYPEFLIYEYANKRMIRLDQAVALMQIIKIIEEEVENEEDFKHLLKQFAAGGGKSSLMIIILVARFARKGFLCTLFNTNELYAIGVHEIAKNLRQSYNIEIEVIERELDHQWSISDLNQLREDLANWRRDRKALLLKPVTWHGINITEMVASLRSDISLQKAADAVLRYFFQVAVSLVDEAYTICDPLQKNITTQGKLLGVAVQHQRLFLEIYSHLLGFQPQSRDLAELAGIIHKSKKMLTAEEFKELQRRLVLLISSFSHYESLSSTELQRYFLQETREKPEWLKALYVQNSVLAGSVVLGRAFIKSMLPHLLTLQFNHHFGTSVHRGDLTPGPMLDGKHVLAHFADLTLIVSLCFHLYHIIGIPSEILHEMISNFENKHKKQRQKTQKEVTPAESDFNQLLPKECSYVHFDAFSSRAKEALSKDPSLRYSFDLLSVFLLDKVFPQIATPAMRIESTAADFQEGFQRIVHLDAAPGLIENYSDTLPEARFFEMLSFEAEVVATLLKLENGQHCLIPLSHNPALLFGSIKEHYPDLFGKMTGLIDRGAYVSDVDPSIAAKVIFDLFDNGDLRQSASFFEEGKMHFFSKVSSLNNRSYPGTDLLGILKWHNIDPKAMLVFLLLDLSKTTGTDVQRPQKDSPGITIGKGQTLSGTIQAAMRERLLLEEEAQTLIWIIFIELYQKISSNKGSFDLRIILSWMVKNDANALNNKIINRAYQCIQRAIKTQVKKRIRAGLMSPEAIKPLIGQLQSVDPYLIYELDSYDDVPEKVLGAYIDELCTLAHLDRQKDLSEHCLSRLSLIIQKTSSLIKLLAKPQGAELNAQVFQEQMQVVKQQLVVQQQQMSQNMQSLGNKFSFAAEVYSRKTDSLDKVFAPDSEYKGVAMYLEQMSDEMLIPSLRLNYRHFLPYSHIKVRNALTHYRPVQAVLILINNEIVNFIACTAAGIQFFETLIREVSPQDRNHYILLGAEVNVLSASLNVTAELKSRVIANQPIRDVITLIALLNGRVRDVEEMVSFIQRHHWTRKDFDAVINAVQKMHISRSQVELSSIPDLAQRCGWENEAKDSPKVIASAPQFKDTVTVTDSTLTPSEVSERVCATRIVIPLRSVLARCLFGQKASGFAQLHTPKNISQKVNELGAGNVFK